MNNKIALVTGAGSVIGRAVSLTLQRAGYSVVLAGRREETLEHTTALADPNEGRMLAIPTDVSQPGPSSLENPVYITGPPHLVPQFLGVPRGPDENQIFDGLTDREGRRNLNDTR